MLERIKLTTRTILHDMERIDLWRQAGSLSFITLLSIVPSLAALLTIISFITSYFAQTEHLVKVIETFILSNLAHSSGQQVVSAMQGYINSINRSQLGITSFSSLLITLILLLRQIEMAFNQIWQVDRERSIFARFVYFWTIITLGAFLFALTWSFGSGFSGWGRFVEETLNSLQGHETWGSVVFSWLVVIIFFSCLFKLVPNRSVPLKYAVAGGSLTGGMFVLARESFETYIRYFWIEQSFYGALAALPLFLIWLYVCWVVVLVGGVLAWRLEHGFSDIPAVEQHSPWSLPGDSLSINRLKALLPFFMYIKIAREFLKGSGTGLTLKQLSAALPLPTAWLQEGIHYLSSKRLILAPAGEGHAENNDEDKAYFPTIPAPVYPLEALRAQLLDPLPQWLAQWQVQAGENYLGMLELLEKHDAEVATLADLLDKVPPLLVDKKRQNHK